MLNMSDYYEFSVSMRSLKDMDYSWKKEASLRNVLYTEADLTESYSYCT
jgi:hypothetical protein